mgnify:CR=1 FL=1
MMRRYISLLFILFGILCLLSCDRNQDKDKAPSIFWGLNISKSPLKTEVLKQELTGFTKTPSLISWHINWEYAFPKYDAEAVIKQGSIPQLIWEPWIWKDKEAIQFDNVIHGEWDTYISQFAKAVKQFNYPIFIQLAPCFNLEDVAWSTASLGKKGANFVQFYRQFLLVF